MIFNDKFEKINQRIDWVKSLISECIKSNQYKECSICGALKNKDFMIESKEVITKDYLVGNNVNFWSFYCPTEKRDEIKISHQCKEHKVKKSKK